MNKRIFLIAGLLLLVGGGIAYYFATQEKEVTTTVAPVEKELEEDVQVSVDLLRFDRDFAGLAEGDYEGKLAAMQKKYGDFLGIYLFQICGFGKDYSDPNLKGNIIGILKNKDIKNLDKSLLKTFGTSDSLKTELKDMFGFLKKYFPSRKLHRVIAINSFFGLQGSVIPAGILDDSTLFVSLECYLGKSFDYSKVDKIFAYQRFSYAKEYIAPKLAETALMYDVMSPEPEGGNLLAHMIYYGKLMYLKKRLLPQTADSAIIEMPGEKLEWCLNSEGSIWALITEKKYLYSIENRIMTRYLNDAPFTPEMPRESPGKVGRWVGWRIVENYMAKHSDMSPADLLKVEDPQKILEGSGYKPKINQ